MFDLSQDHLGRKSVSERRYSDGLEAPRNSLDIPTGIYHFLRQSGARHDEIPTAIEFQLLPARKSKLVDLELKISGDLEARSKGPSVVARLMGLDALPKQQGAQQPPKKPIDERISQQRQEIRQPQGSDLPPKFANASIGRPHKVQNTAKIILHPEEDEADEMLQMKSLPFRDHPQEKQLQEFKKHFQERQALQTRERFRQEKRNEELEITKAKTILAAKKIGFLKLNSSKADYQESKEFQETLEFLRSNKEFFLKFLQEPNSTNAKQYEAFPSVEGRRPAKMKQMTKPVAGQIAHEFPEHARQTFNSEIFNQQRTLYSDSKLLLRRQRAIPVLESMEMPVGSTIERPTGLAMQRPMGVAMERPMGAAMQRPVGVAVQKSVGAAMERPMGAAMQRSVGATVQRPAPPDRGAVARLVDPTRQNFPLSTNIKSTGTDNNTTSIVVLKSNPVKSTRVKNLPHSSGSTRLSANSRDVKGCTGPTKERDKMRQGNLQVRNEEIRTGKETDKDRMRVALTNDPRQVAREIAQQVRNSVAKERGKLFFSGNEKLSTRPLQSVRRLNRVKIGNSNDFTESSEGEVASAPVSRRLVRDYRPALSSSQPTSPAMPKLADAPNITSKEGKFQLIEKLRKFQIRGTEELVKETRMLPKNLSQIEPVKPPLIRSQANSRNMKELGKNMSKNILSYPDNSQLDGGISVGSSTGLHTLAEEDNSNCTTAFTVSNTTSHFSSAEESSEGEAQIYMDHKWNRKRPEASMGRAPLEPFKDFGGQIALKEGSFLQKKFLSGKSHQPRKKIIRQSQTPAQHIVAKGVQPNNSSGTDPTCYFQDMDTDMRMTTMHHQAVTSIQSLSKMQQLHPQNLKEADLCMEDQHGERQITLLDGNVQAEDQSSTKTTLWSLTSESLDKVDSTAEITNEKSEQPSPVSVLDSLFEESPPGNLKEVTSELQELSLRLRFLKLDGQKLSGSMEALQIVEACKVISDLQKQEGPSDEAAGTAHISHSDTKGHVFPSIGQLPPETLSESTWIEKLSCPVGREEELNYFKKLILMSGLNENISAKLPFSVQSLYVAFARLEDPTVMSAMLGDEEASEREASDSKLQKISHEQKGLSNKQLLLDSVRESIVSQLQIYCDSQSWILAGRGSSCSKPNLRELLKQAWIRILQHDETFDEESNSNLDHIVEKDLAEEQWMQVNDEILEVGDGLEMLIFCDLLQDATTNIINCKNCFM